MVTLQPRQGGVTYLALLLAIAMVSGVLAASASVWSHIQQREREKQLLWAGEQFRRAIAAYARAGNGSYPRALEDLLEDSRSLVRRRFLRQIYEDPMTRGTDWGLIRNPQGGIIAVHSRHQGVPIKTGQFPALYSRFERAKTYADWKFAAVLLPSNDDLREAQSATGNSDSARQSGTGEASSVESKPAGPGKAGVPAGTPAQPAAANAPRVPGRATGIDSTQPQANGFARSPLTPLQSLQSPYVPGALPGTPAIASPNLPANPASARPAEPAAPDQQPKEAAREGQASEKATPQ